MIIEEIKQTDLSDKWKVDTVKLLKLLLENNVNGSILENPVRILQSLLIELAERALEINDDGLNKILLKLCLIEAI